MLDLNKLTDEALNVAELMEGREKGETQELIEYGKPVTICACEQTNMVKEDGTAIWIFLVKEFPDKFFFAGMIIDKLFNYYLKAAEGDLDEVYDTIKKKGLKGVFSEKKTKNKRTVTDFKRVG